MGCPHFFGNPNVFFGLVKHQTWGAKKAWTQKHPKFYGSTYDAVEGQSHTRTETYRSSCVSPVLVLHGAETENHQLSAELAIATMWAPKFRLLAYDIL